jgi:O-acetyl-ADP-ribose deacetylase (regulator of RNase III)
MLTEIKGDLFLTDAKILCHGCNTKGKMFAGIAKEFHARYPKMFIEYQRLCRMNQFNLGDCFVYEAVDGRFIANLASQEYPGPDAREEAIVESLQKLFNKCKEMSCDVVAMPRIGCGIGGLDWSNVKPVIEKLSDEFSINVLVYYL